MAQLADAVGSKPAALWGMWVRIPLRAPRSCRSEPHRALSRSPVSPDWSADLEGTPRGYGVLLSLDRVGGEEEVREELRQPGDADAGSALAPSVLGFFAMLIASVSSGCGAIQPLYGSSRSERREISPWSCMSCVRSSDQRWAAVLPCGLGGHPRRAPKVRQGRRPRERTLVARWSPSTVTGHDSHTQTRRKQTP